MKKKLLLSTKRVNRFSMVLIAVLSALCTNAIAQPTFVGGSPQTLTVCENSGAGSINALLRVSDPVSGSVETWTTASAPAHGTLAASYSVTSTGGTLTPSGLTYTPNTNYSGTDVFTVHVSNGTVTASTTVSVTVTALPAAIGGTFSVCTGATATLTDATSGGVWSSTNTGIATISTSGVVAGISAGTSVISYTKSGCSVVATATDLAVPSVISGAATVCVGSTITLSDSSASGTWTSSAPTHASVVAATGVVTGVAQGAATITYSTGCGTAATFSVTAIATPVAITGTSTVCAAANTTLADASTGGIWSTSNTSIATNNAGVITGISGGTVTVTYSTGCGSPATAVVTVKGSPASITGAATVCIGSTITLSDSTLGGTWASTNTGRATVVSTTGAVTGVAAGTLNINYSIGCGTTATYAITVLSAPAAITGTTVLCTGADVILADATTGGTWSVSNSSIATNTGSEIYGVSAGTVTVTYSDGCGTPATTVVTVKGNPASITGASTICIGSSITFTDSTSGGTWSSSSTGRASVTSTTGVVTGIAAGAVNISYTNGCGTVTYPTTVLAAPAAITGTPSVCATANVILADATAGGSWSSSNTAIASVSGGAIYGIASGTALISYSTGCGSPATTTFTVKGFSPTISGPSTVCVGSTITLSDTVAGGTWSSSYTSRASVVSSTGIVTGVAAGAVNISYANGCGTATYPITTVASPAAITGTSSVCATADVILADATAGGTWSTSNTAIATNNSGDIYGISGGTVTVTYNTGCGTPATTVFTVKGIPAAITGPSTVCVGSAITLSETTASGTWTSSNGGRATVVSTTGVVTGVGAGAVNMTYSDGCGTAATYALTVFASPGSISGTTSIYIGSSTTLADAAAGGTWTSGNTSIATISTAGVITGVASGTSTITYSTGCGSNAMVVETVANGPAPISGATTVCVGSTISLSDVTPGGTWSSSNTGRATVVSTTGVVTGVAAGTLNINYVTSGGTATYAITVLAAPAAITGTPSVCASADVILADATANGTWSTSNTAIATNNAGDIYGISAGTVTVTYSTGCGSAASTTFTVKGAPSSITGATTVCVGSSIALSDSIAGGTWSSSVTSRATVINTTGVVTGVGAGAVNITYNNGCGTATYPITVIGSPAGITGTTSVCAGADVILADATAGGTWSTSNTAIATNSGADIFGISAGTVTVTYNNGCGTPASTVFTVKGAPSLVTGPTSVCVGSTITLSDSLAGGTWTSSYTPRATVINSTGVLTGVSAGSVNVTYSNGCGAAATYPITVIASPAGITGTTSVCPGANAILADATAGGTWSTSNTAIASNSGADIYGISAGTVTVTYSNGCGAGASTVFTVKGVPSAITGLSTVCTGSQIILSDSASNGTWSSGSGRATVVSTTGVVTGVSAGAVNITYSTGCGASATTAITVIGSPAAITGTTNVCIGADVILADATSGGTWSTGNTAIATNSGSVITGVSAGTVTVSYGNGCGAPSSIVFTVKATPTSVSGSNSICPNATVTLSDSALLGTWSSSNTARATVISTSGVVTGVAAGAVNITYNNGCGTATLAMTVLGAPVAITGTMTDCIGATTALSDATAGGTWSSATPSVATVSTSGVVRGITAGAASIFYTGATCAATTVVTVQTTPHAITGSTSVCNGSTITLADSITGGVWTSVTTSVATVNSASGVVSGIAAGTSVISYSTGCGTPVTATVTVQTTPSSISGTSAFCSGSPVTFSDAVSGGSWSSSAPVVATIDPASGVGVGLSTGNANISYALTNACGSYVVSYGISVTALGTWLGSSNSSWSNSANWACGTIPSATQSAIIPGASAYSNAPTLDISTAYAKNLTIYSTGVLSLGSNQLDVAGNIVNNGVINGSGAVYLNGSSAQVLSGKGFVSNLTLANSAGASINSTSDSVGVTGTLLLNSGTLTTNGTLVLVSDSVDNGNIGTITGGSISGNVVMEQYVPAGRRAYRFIAHPFSGSISLNQIEPYIDITGNGGSANGFTTTITNASSAYWYNSLYGNSSLGADPGWRSFTNTSGTPDSNMLHQYQGMRLFVRGSKGEGLDGAAYVVDAATYRTYGNVNTGAQTISMVKGTGANADYNLLGNPYPAITDIGTVIDNASAAGQVTGGAYYVWDPYRSTAGQFITVPVGTGAFYLGANESFELRTAANGDVLNFTESNKGNAVSMALMRTGIDQYLTLNIYDNAYHPWDMLYVKFNDAATDNEDAKYDGTKPPSPAVLNFYSLSADNKKLSLDARPYNAGKVIPLGITSSIAQEFIIKADNVAVPAGSQVYLHDKYLQTNTLLQQGTEYKFAITADSLSQGDKRFELRMGNTEGAVAQQVANLNVTMMPNPATSDVTITYQTQGKDNTSVTLTDVTGNVVISKNLGTQQSGSTAINLEKLPSGIYIVELTSGNEKAVQRLVKE